MFSVYFGAAVSFTCLGISAWMGYLQFKYPTNEALGFVAFLAGILAMVCAVFTIAVAQHS